DTAVIVVHPWGIDDGQGWATPQPAGVAFACTPLKNQICLKHARTVVNPFLTSLRGKVGMIAFSLPGEEDPIRKKLYRSIRGEPSEADRREGAQALEGKLKAFSYAGGGLEEHLSLSKEKPIIDYFRQFPGLDSGDKFDPAGFWKLPIPVTRGIDVAP